MLAIIVILNRIPVVWMRSCAIVIALAVGYALAGYMGRLDFTGMHEAALFQVPTPLHFGLSFSWALFIPMLVIYLVTSLEAIGDVTATSKVSRQPVEGRYGCSGSRVACWSTAPTRCWRACSTPSRVQSLRRITA